MNLTPEQIVVDVCVLATLLLVGTLIRSRVTVLAKWLMPAAVIGGIVGFILGPEVLGLMPMNQKLFAGYSAALTNVVFAGMFLGRKVPRASEFGAMAGAQTLFAVLCNLAQVGIGMLAVVASGLLGYSLHTGFGFQLVWAFQGGPGIPTALGKMYEQLGWSAHEAAAVGEVAAIAGLLLAVVVGMILANYGVRHGFSQGTSVDEIKVGSTFLSPKHRPSLGASVVDQEALSGMAYSLAWVGLAILAGLGLRKGLSTLCAPLGKVPLFTYSLVLGLVIQVILQWLRLDTYVDRASIVSIQGLALDLLIVAALASVSLRVVITYAAPLIGMLVLGLAWNLFWVMWLAPRMLPGAWFEKALAEFGQATGSTSEALLLLRMVDPGLKTDAGDAFAIKMFLTSPTMIPLMIFLSSFAARVGALATFGWMVLGCGLIVVVSRLVGWWYRRPQVRWF